MPDTINEWFPDHGITSSTPANVMIGAGVLIRDFSWTDTKEQRATKVIAATSGGNKFSLKPNLIDLELDGANVKVEQVSHVKIGEEASIEMKLVELTPDLIKRAVIGESGESDAAGYDMIKSKDNISADDYYDNLAFVGKKTDGSPIVILFEKALITGGIELEGKNGEKSSYPVTVECVAPINDEGTTYSTLPYKIYTKKTTVTPPPEGGSEG